MKRINYVIAALMMFCIAATTKAQSPQAFKYQAIARNTNGDAIANQPVSFRISILQGSAEGTIVYQETQTATTNQFGLANLSIGMGTVITGLFDSIKWGNGTYFIKIEFDPKGGDNYLTMGTTQMMSVPYSLYSEHAKMADSIKSFPIRVALNATNSQAPFDNPQTGTLVYNIDSAGIAPYNVVPGYYYNAGTAANPNWVLLSSVDNAGLTRKALAAPLYWQTAGDAGTTAGTNFVGTTDGEDLVFKVNSTFAGELDYYDANTFYGVYSGSVNAYGQDNTGIGSGALANLSSAACTGCSYNTAVGAGALGDNTSGLSNTAVGYGALSFNNTIGSYNTAIGSSTLLDNSTAGNNVAVGWGALSYQSYNGGSASTQWNSSNVAIGDSALSYNQPTSQSNGIDNTAEGTASLYSNTTGMDNAANGFKALFSSKTASSNTANGAYSLYNSTGSWNTAVGDSALFSNGTGTYNVAMGYAALAANDGGSNSVAVGYNALSTITNAGNNTAIGYKAMQSATGYYSTSIGYESLLSNTGNYNTAAGIYSLYSNTSGAGNTGVGVNASYSNTSGKDNTIIGGDALQYNVTGSGNTAGGYFALHGVSTNSADYNTAMGDSALFANTTGGDNTAVGYSTLDANTTGSENTAIGFGANVSSGTLTNATSIGYNASATASNTVQLGNGSVSTLYFGTGNNLPTTSSAANVFYNSSTGEFFRSTSSRRYKKNITDLKINTAMIYKLRAVSYVSKADNTPHFGLIAEEVAQVIPELAEYAEEKDVVKGSTSDSLIPDAVQYPLLSVLLLKEVQKHEKTIAEQEQVIDSLEKVNTAQAVSIQSLQTTQTQIKQEQDNKMVNQEKEIAELKKLVDAMTQAQASIK